MILPFMLLDFSKIVLNYRLQSEFGFQQCRTKVNGEGTQKVVTVKM